MPPFLLVSRPVPFVGDDVVQSISTSLCPESPPLQPCVYIPRFQVFLYIINVFIRMNCSFKNNKLKKTKEKKTQSVNEHNVYPCFSLPTSIPCAFDVAIAMQQFS